MLQQLRQYSLDTLQDEVRALVSKGVIARQCKIHNLARFFSDRDWLQVEQILTANEYLLRDYVCDLIGRETWLND